MRKLNKELLAENLEKRIENDISLNNVCGVSVLVKQSGTIIYKNHFGTVSPESQTPVSDETMFRLASMTKPITGVAAMILVDRGLLSLDDTIDKFIPAFSSPYILDENGEKIYVDQKITVKHLLTHTSGIGSGSQWKKSVELLTPQDRSSVRNFVDFISKRPLSYIPGTKTEYSGVAAFSVMTYIIEQLSGKDYESFLKDEIFTPCEMKDTTFAPSDEQWARVITMHDKKDGKSVIGETWKGCAYNAYPPSNPLGGAGLVSSLNDYMNFADMLLAGGVFGGNRIISDESFKMLSTPQVSPEIQSGFRRWGLSMRVITNESYARLPVGAFGWSGAYGTHFWVDPTNEIVGIYMKNSRFDGGSGAKTAANFERDVAAALI